MQNNFCHFAKEIKSTVAASKGYCISNPETLKELDIKFNKCALLHL